MHAAPHEQSTYLSVRCRFEELMKALPASLPAFAKDWREEGSILDVSATTVLSNCDEFKAYLLIISE